MPSRIDPSEDLAKIPPRRALTHLRVPFAYVTDDGIQHLARHPNLTEINLEFTAVSTDGEKRLQSAFGRFLIVIIRDKQEDLDILSRQVQSVRDGKTNDIWLLGLNIRDADLRLLEGVAGIEELCLEHTWVTGPGLDFISDPGRLQKLSLKRCRLDEDAFDRLNRFKNLRHLDLSSTCVTTPILQELLLDLPHIEELHLEDCDVDDRLIASLARLDHLKVLMLIGTRVTEQGISQLYDKNPALELY